MEQADIPCHLNVAFEESGEPTSLPMHGNATLTTTENAIIRGALAGNPNERLAYPNDTATCRALAVNSVVSRAFAMNTVSPHRDALNTGAAAITDSIHTNATIAFAVYAIRGSTGSANPNRGVARTPNANSGWDIADNSNAAPTP
jgi:hypothetical protein